MLPTRAETTVLVNRTQLTLSEESIANEVDETGKGLDILFSGVVGSNILP